jgi:hypothetical protein
MVAARGKRNADAALALEESTSGLPGYSRSSNIDSLRADAEARIWPHPQKLGPAPPLRKPFVESPLMSHLLVKPYLSATTG